MNEALKELKQIIKIRDEKNWKATETRENALEKWISNWVVTLKYEQPIINPKALSVEFEDFLKEHVGSKLTEQAMEHSININKENNRLKGEMVCIKRRKGV